MADQYIDSVHASARAGPTQGVPKKLLEVQPFAYPALLPLEEWINFAVTSNDAAVDYWTRQVLADSSRTAVILPNASGARHSYGLPGTRAEVAELRVLQLTKASSGACTSGMRLFVPRVRLLRSRAQQCA